MPLDYEIPYTTVHIFLQLSAINGVKSKKDFKLHVPMPFRSIRSWEKNTVFHHTPSIFFTNTLKAFNQSYQTKVRFTAINTRPIEYYVSNEDESVNPIFISSTGICCFLTPITHSEQADTLCTFFLSYFSFLMCHWTGF